MPMESAFLPYQSTNPGHPLEKKCAVRFVLGSSPDVAVVTAQYSLKKRENIRLSPDVEPAKGGI
jgi:hypothetical protein